MAACHKGGALGGGRHGAHVFSEAVGGGRGQKAAAGFLEERYAQNGLKLGDLAPNGRLRLAQLAGGSRKGPGVERGQKGARVVPVKGWR